MSRTATPPRKSRDDVGTSRARGARNESPVARRGRARVLVVDDNFDARLILEEALTSAGYAVTVAKNGIEALALLRAMKVDLLIIDLQMPELGGRPAIRAIRALKGRFARLPIIVVSAFAPPTIPGVQAVIAKPASLDVLVQRVAEILGARGG